MQVNKQFLPNILRCRKVIGLKDPQLNNTTLVLEATVPHKPAILSLRQSIPKYRLLYSLLPLATAYPIILIVAWKEKHGGHSMKYGD